MPHVAVVGAGIAGLAAARALRRLRPDVDITVIDGASGIGGKLRTGVIAGLPVDEGAESFLFGPPEAVGLAEDVGLAADLVHPATSSASVWSRGALRPLPRTLLGVPAGLGGLLPVLGVAGTVRVAADLVLPRTPTGDDVAVGRHLRARIGSAAVDRLVDPLLGGVYAGHADELSMRATMPTLDLRERSVVRAVRKALPQPSGRPVFAGIDGGLGRLVDATAAASGAHFVLHRPVRSLARTVAGWRVVHGSTRDEQALDVDAVVLALPATPASRLLAAAVPAAAADLATIDYASVGIVTLVWPRAHFPAVRGSGYLVPAVEGRPVKAVTFASAKWPHLDHADVVAVRCSFGRAGEVRDLQRDDADLVTDAVTELRLSVGVEGLPVATRVTRWGGALPQYAVGHLDLVARVRAAVAAVPGLAVCGAAYDGVGIPACIRSADAAVREVLAALPATGASATMGA